MVEVWVMWSWVEWCGIWRSGSYTANPSCAWSNQRLIKQRAATERSENTSLHDFKHHYLYCLIGIYPEHDFRLFEDSQTILDIYSNVVGKLMTRRSWRAVLRACAWFRRQLEGWERIEMGCCLNERWRSDQPAHVGWLWWLFDVVLYVFSVITVVNCWYMLDDAGATQVFPLLLLLQCLWTVLFGAGEMPDVMMYL